MKKCFKIYIGKIGNQKDNNMAADLIQLQLIKTYELRRSCRTN